MPRRLSCSFRLFLAPLLALTLPLWGCSTPADMPEPDLGAPDLATPLGPDEIPLVVEQRCPGGPDCADSGDNVLYVGVAKRDITPQIEPFTDTNKNSVYDEGEPYTDVNKNGKFDEYWLAGFSGGRQAYGVLDPVWARAIAIRQNQTTVVLVAVDSVGLFWDETPEVEKLLDKRLGVDLLMLHATHNHETADTTGGWGRDFLTYGVNEEYQRSYRRAIADAITEAVQGVRPARMTASSVLVEDGPNHDMLPYVNDTRDPVVIDNTLHTLQFVDVSATPPQPIATLVNWANHPEALGSDNHLVSSDFVHHLRTELESKGAGTVVYVTGALGGLLGPGHAVPVDEKGVKYPKDGPQKSEVLGRSVAKFALSAMADPKAKTVAGKDARLNFRTTSFKVHIENLKYQYAAKLRIFRRSFCCYDEGRPLSDENVPSAITKVAYLNLGPASIITNPGELTPELFLGGYGGEHKGTYDLVDYMRPNAPNLAMAPKGPYLVDLMEGDRAHRMTFGLTFDFLGYIVPRYTWLLDERKPYFDGAPGDHYEETNSVGPRGEAEIVGTMRQLILDGKKP
ncbi:MAG TPA: neutral/alkaline non-lysosomal ceramidase N-terminal domain-containing protein [Pseudomonadota bacterium]|nr:neutral/alkaline non-lysosomal ceramidase N-terminal domain-containing protein [Pseudomonadota bacterium]